MIDYIPYVVIIAIIILLFSYLYIKQKFGFWVSQPVFHVYDFYYYLHSVGIINKDLPSKNKYTNFKNIKTYTFNSLIDYQKQKLVHFIRNNFYREKNGDFLPKEINIYPYLINNTHKSFVSFYYEDIKLLSNKGNNIVDDQKIIAVITSKPLSIYISQDNATFDCYYIDYLCVDKSYRKTGIAPQIIQTHHYNQSYLNKQISVSIFKREGELTGIVPLCVYDTYGFPVTTWNKPSELSNNYQFIFVNKSNIYLFKHFITEMHSKFEIAITPSISNLLELVKTKNMIITMLVSNNEIYSCYFFRKTCVVSNKLEALSCVASINNIDSHTFIHGFKISFWKIAEKYHFGYCIIENISHNNIIIDNLILKTKPDTKSPTAYFFYNFAFSTFPNYKTLIIN